MSGDQSLEVKEALESILKELDQLEGLVPSSLRNEFRSRFDSMRSTLISSAGIGECQEAFPFAPLRPILKNGVLTWCCTHNPPHCS